MIDLWVCSKPQGSQRATLQRLTQAVIGSMANVKQPVPTATDIKMNEGYSWVSNGELFTLLADAIATDDGWMGNFQLGRCRSAT